MDDNGVQRMLDCGIQRIGCHSYELFYFNLSLSLSLGALVQLYAFTGCLIGASVSLTHSRWPPGALQWKEPYSHRTIPSPRKVFSEYIKTSCRIGSTLEHRVACVSHVPNTCSSRRWVQVVSTVPLEKQVFFRSEVPRVYCARSQCCNGVSNCCCYC